MKSLTRLFSSGLLLSSLAFRNKSALISAVKECEGMTALDHAKGEEHNDVIKLLQ